MDIKTFNVCCSGGNMGERHYCTQAGGLINNTTKTQEELCIEAQTKFIPFCTELSQEPRFEMLTLIYESIAQSYEAGRKAEREVISNKIQAILMRDTHGAYHDELYPVSELEDFINSRNETPHN